MQKRRFLKVLAATLASLPLRPHAQGTKRIGFLVPQAEADAEAQREIAAFRSELHKLGWPESERLRIDYRWAGGDFARLRPLARELLSLKPDVIVCRTTPATRAMLAETRSIPVVFFVVSDPLGDGIVASLARPGGNVTGFTNVEASLGGKWLELLKELAPRMERVGALYNPKTAPGGGGYYLRLMSDAASRIGVTLLPLVVQDIAGIERAIGTLAAEPRAGLVVIPDATNITHRKPIIAAVAHHRLPAIYPVPTFTMEGGLASYGVDVVDLYRRGAGYVDRILRGEKPNQLPVQGPIKFELTVNARTANTLGIELPRSLLLRADKVIE